MGCTAELAAEIWERQQEILESGVTSEDMPGALDQELAALERSLGSSFVDWFDSLKTGHLPEEETDAWNQWFRQLNNGDGGIWSELSDRMEALYDAEECYAYNCYRLALEQEAATRANEGERYQKSA
jgi:hypothetical protein